MTIRKFPLETTDEQIIRVPEINRPLTIQMQGGAFPRAVVEPDAFAIRSVKVRTFGTGLSAKPEDIALYQNSPEIHAAVHVIGNLAEEYRQQMETFDAGERALARVRFFERVVEFFANFDRVRTDQIESLKAQVLKLVENQPVSFRL